MTDLPPTQGLLVDPHHPRFLLGKDNAFADWWDVGEYNPRATDEEYTEGYAFGWEMASDPLHEDGYDPQLDPAIDKPHR